MSITSEFPLENRRMLCSQAPGIDPRNMCLCLRDLDKLEKTRLESWLLELLQY